MLTLDLQNHNKDCFCDSLDRFLYLKKDVWQKTLNKWICEFMGKHSDIKWMQYNRQTYSGLLLPVKIIFPNDNGIASDCFLTKIEVCYRSSVPINEITNEISNHLFYKISFCFQGGNNDKSICKQKDC